MCRAAARAKRASAVASQLDTRVSLHSHGLLAMPAFVVDNRCESLFSSCGDGRAPSVPVSFLHCFSCSYLEVPSVQSILAQSSFCHHHLCCFRSADFAMDIAKLAHSQARGVAWMGLIFRYCLRFETTVSAPPSVFCSVCSVINTHSIHQNTTAQHTHTHTHHAAQPNEWFTSVCMH